MAEIELLDLRLTERTSDVDAIKLYGLSKLHPIRWMFIKRLKLILSLIPERAADTRLLEVGFGCGIMLPELTKRSSDYYGIDVHDYVETVASKLSPHYPGCHFSKQSIVKTDFPDDFFDVVFSLSVMEHIVEIDQAIAEIRRILKPGGRFVVGFPIENFASNFVLDIVKHINGFDRKVHHPTNHRQILAALENNLKEETRNCYPIKSRVESSMFYTGVWLKEGTKRA
jgi:ubiquinone/menaquinone biosynthesis C-methylase UbiE